LSYRDTPSTWKCPKGHIRTIPIGEVDEPVMCDRCGWKLETKEVMDENRVLHARPQVPQPSELGFSLEAQEDQPVDVLRPKNKKRSR
jgi:hypothetical protein